MGDQTIKTISFAAALLGLAVIVGYLVFGRSHPGVFKVARIGEASVNVEVVESLSAQQRGLSGRASLAADSGMLFVYTNKDVRYFWMPNMRFPLDVIWIADGVVVGWQENIASLTGAGEITRFQSNAPVDMVLEVNRGWIGKYGIKVGDKVEY